MPRQVTAGRYSQSLIKSILPYGIRQLGKSEDKVYADVFHTGFFENMIGTPGHRRIMPSVHKSEYGVIKRLHSHADTVHAHVHESFHISMAFLYNIFRIDFDSKFLIWAVPGHRSQRINDSSQSRKRQHRRGATSYI